MIRFFRFLSETKTPSVSEKMEDLIERLRRYCAVASYLTCDETGKPVENETDFAQVLSNELQPFSWLTTSLELIGDGNRVNVLATDCPLTETQLLIVGHLDTVNPSTGWTVDRGTIKEGRYYDLGAIDTKGSMAACLEAIGLVGPTHGVTYLFYSDEEYYLKGMEAFVVAHPEMKPTHIMSLCGGHGQMMLGCRGCVEVHFVLTGKSGHASRPHQGVNAIALGSIVVQQLEQRLMAIQTPMKTAFNIGAIHGGSLVRLNDGVPELVERPNKIADAVRILLDIRPGSNVIDATVVESLIRDIVRELNEQIVQRGGIGELKVAHLSVKIDAGGFHTTSEQAGLFFSSFQDFLAGQTEPVMNPGNFGYIDVAMLAPSGAAIVCMSPAGGNPHASDEFVEIESLLAYRQGLLNLIRTFKTRE